MKSMKVIFLRLGWGYQSMFIEYNEHIQNPVLSTQAVKDSLMPVNQSIQ